MQETLLTPLHSLEEGVKRERASCLEGAGCRGIGRLFLVIRQRGWKGNTFEQPLETRTFQPRSLWPEDLEHGTCPRWRDQNGEGVRGPQDGLPPPRAGLCLPLWGLGRHGVPAALPPWAVWVQFFPSAPETDPALVCHPGLRMAGAISKKHFLKMRNCKCAESR